jgi:oligopeptidase B
MAHQPAPSAPPVAARRPHLSVWHGETLEDPYHWLRDPHYPTIDDPDILAHIESENAWFEAQMAPLKGLVATIFDELKGRVTPDDASVPVKDGDFEYWTRYEPGGQYRLWLRRPVAGGAEQIILSEPELAQGHDYFRLAGTAISPDGRLLAYATDTAGDERFTLKIRDLATGRDIETVTDKSVGTPAWSADSTALAWVEVNENWRRFAIRLHRIGGGSSTLYEETTDIGFGVGLTTSQDRRWFILTTADNVTSEIRLLPTNDPSAAPLLIRQRKPGVTYDVDVRGATLFIRANDTHPNFRLVTAPVTAPGDWTELLAPSDRDYLTGLTAFASCLVISARRDGLDQIRLRRDDGSEIRVPFAEASYTAHVGSNPEPDVTRLRLHYSSMVTPATVYDYDIATAMLIPRKVQQIPSGYDASQYETARLTITARDGAQVPVSIVFKKGFPRDGTGKVHLYAYGAYGYAYPPGFVANRLSLLDRGLAFAIAHVRGGDDLGYQWYLDGKLEKRTNTFNDFVDVAKGLNALGWAAPGQISANGGSAGGELMGVIANTDPGLWRAIVADVPFVDVLNTMLDDSLPLTPGEWPEWGNPITDKAAFDLIKSYSPYDNVTAQDYPPMLVTAGLNDPRVTYWEPAKWVAKLRDQKTDSNPLLLKTNMGAGHGGKSGRFSALEEIAEEYAFILQAFGLAP